MIKKVVSLSGLVTLLPTVNAASPIKNEPSKPLPMKPSDLPIYDAPHSEYAEHMENTSVADNTSQLRTMLLEPVSAVRETVQTGVAHFSSVKYVIQDNYQEFQDRTDWIVKYLREEENKDMRYGAVAMGGLTGFIFGLRGGFIRRLFYTGLATTGMGYVCFPESTKEILHNNGVLAKQYANIAYNFFYGVKPGDPQLEIKLPELSFPKDFSEFIDLTTSLASTAKTAIMPPSAKDDSKAGDKKE